MISYSDYINYFQKLSSEHAQIKHSDSEKHFFRTTLEEVLAAIPNRTIRYPAVMLLPLEIRTLGNSDNAYERIYGGFLILEALRKPEDHARREEILKNTRIIGDDFICRIRHDVYNCQVPFAQKLFVQFDDTAVIKKEWGPVWDNAFGWSYEFSLFAPYNHKYNAGVWITS